jgi:predicted MFS family arabinose efflux permease
MSERRGITAPLRVRQFRLLVSGQLISNLGDWVDYLALAVLIAYVWHKGPGSLAALAIAIAAPWIAVAPFSGVLADRWPKRTAMIGADLARAGLVVGFIFAPNLPVLLVLVFFKTCFSTLFSPAEQATIRFTVPEDLLHAANSLSQLVLQSTKVVGPALGGLIVGLSGPKTAFGIDAVSFLCSAAILSRLAPVGAVAGDADETPEPANGGFWSELREGLAYILSRRALVISTASFAAAIFLLLAFDSLSPLAFRELGVSRALFGLAIAGIGLGGVLGAIAVGRYGGDANPFGLLGIGAAVIGGLVALIGVALLANLGAPAIVWTPVLIVVGFASAAMLISSPTILQRETPPELMGRVSTSATSIPMVAQLFAPIVGASLAAWKSVGFVFTAAGCGLALLGVVVLILRPPVGIGVPGSDDAELDVREENAASFTPVQASTKGAQA